MRAVIKLKKQTRKQGRGGRPRIILSDEQKKLAIEYVKKSGLWKTRLARFLKINFRTFERILEIDKGFYNDLQSADAFFIAETIQRAKPEFILKTKYRDEFPDNSFDPGIGQHAEELDAVILRIRQILPASGQ